MSEKQKMLAGEPYDPADPELTADRLHARTLIHTLNHAEPRRTGRRRTHERCLPQTVRQWRRYGLARTTFSLRLRDQHLS
ncbi:maltose acetyltransferase domain-containing protein [Rubripirellula amarantea]|uniref:maltose acetyltransferase domain-containing protein n=1 Tax=Rubripirellula amarantea TaxID=2527999 RepID=UPI0028F43872|nr:maltose acetyltransferase domain-containing protein [Rubripirellula amarantea]